MNEEAQQPQAGKEASYPVFDLPTCIEFANTIKELGGSKAPVKKSIIAKHVGLAESTPSFFQKLGSSKIFGIIDGWGAYQLTDLGRAYFYPTSEDGKARVGLQLLTKPPVFAHLASRFDGEKLPPNNVLGNILHQEFGIPDSWKDRLGLLFVKSAHYLGIIDATGVLRYDAAMNTSCSEPFVDSPVGVPVSRRQVEIAAAASTPVTGRAVWHFPYKGSYVRLDTPEDIPSELWEKLNAYVQVIKPTKE